MALRSRYVELANGLDNVRFNGCRAGCYPVPAHNLGARETDFKHFEIETELVSHLSFAASDVPAESERRTFNQDAGRSLVKRMTILAPLRIEERDALHNEKVRRARMRGGERLVRREARPVHVRDGSFTSVSRHPTDVRFTLNCGHRRASQRTR